MEKTEPIHAALLLIGAGKMGGALLSAWRHKTIGTITVLEKEHGQAQQLSGEGVTCISSLDEVTETPDCIVFAVKPQSMDALLTELEASSLRRPGSHALYISIAAGKTLAYFHKYLEGAPVVRAMPNTPALIRKGITALCASPDVSDDQKHLATLLLSAAGEVVWLDDESQMDAVTAISGSGPAYVFLFLEALIEAGKAQGLPEDIATKLACQTFRGSVKLAMKSGEPLSTLRKNVTSPGGTTEAALKVLMKKGGLEALVGEAVKAAVKRAGELA